MSENIKQSDKSVSDFDLNLDGIVDASVGIENIGVVNKKIKSTGDGKSVVGKVVIKDDDNEVKVDEKSVKKRKLVFKSNFSLKDSYAVNLRLTLKPVNVLIPLERYVLYNDLYSSRRVFVSVGNRRIPVTKFPIAYVEVFALRDDTNNYYVVVTPMQIMMMNPRTRSIAEHEKKVKDVLRNALQGLIAKDVVKEYSDELRVHYFKELWMLYWKLLNEGKIPKSPVPGWESQNLFRVIDDVLRFSLGFHDFEYLFFDYGVEDIFLNGVNSNIFLQHTKYNYMKANITVDYVELHRVVTAISQMTFSKFNYKRPVIDMQILGHFNIRVNLTHDTFSIDGYTLTMRKARETPISLPKLVYDERFGSLNDEVATLLWEFIHRGVSALVVGETGSGKTTLLKSLLTTAPRSDRIVTLEDTVEFPNYQKWGFHHVRWSARSPLSKTEPDEYDLELASKNLLRARPKIVVLGEIRYTEARTFFEILQMGVANAYSTAHGSSPVAILRRLVYSMGVEPTSLGDLDVIIQMKTFRPVNRLIRKVTHVAYVEEANADGEGDGDYSFEVSSDASIRYDIKNFVKYWFMVRKDAQEVDEGWQIFWNKFFGSKVYSKLKNLTGYDDETIIDELNEKYNILRVMKNGIMDDIEKELFRSLKLFDIYYIIKRDYNSFGEETFNIFLKEYKKLYGTTPKVRYSELIDKHILNSL